MYSLYEYCKDMPLSHVIQHLLSHLDNITELKVLITMVSETKVENISGKF